MVLRAGHLRTLLAALLLLVQSLLPGVHRLQHALADARAHAPERCACGHLHEGAASQPPSGPALRDGHEHGAQECTLCQLLAKVRHWLPAGNAAEAAPGLPVDAAIVALAPVLPGLAELPAPPARGPPVA